MRKIFALAAVLAAAGSTAMWAADQQITLNATVPKFCKYNAAGFFDSFPNTTPGASVPGTSVISITNPVNTSGIMQNWGFTFKVNGTCNAISNLELTTQNGGLTTASSAPGFVNRFDYTAQVSFDGAGPATIPSTNGTPGASSIAPPHPTTGAHVGDVVLQVTGLPNIAQPVLGGFYTDTLTITLTPQ